jgi:hypothetical protein
VIRVMASCFARRRGVWVPVAARRAEVGCDLGGLGMAGFFVWAYNRMC